MSIDSVPYKSQYKFKHDFINTNVDAIIYCININNPNVTFTLSLTLMTFRSKKQIKNQKFEICMSTQIR